MVNLLLSFVILLILILGIKTVLSDLYHHYIKQRLLSETEKKWKIVLSVVGCVIAVNKIEYIYYTIST